MLDLRLSAVPGFGAMVDGQPRVHGICLFRQRPEMMRDWERIKQRDTLNQLAFSRLGQTLIATGAGLPGGTAFDPVIARHARRYGMAHVLATVCMDRLTGLFAALSFYRADPARPFSERERWFAQWLKPHLVRAWNIHRMLAST